MLVGGGGEQPRVVVDGGALTDPKAGEARRARLGSTLTRCLTQVLDAAPYQREDGSDELRALQVAARLASSASGDVPLASPSSATARRTPGCSTCARWAT